MQVETLFLEFRGQRVRLDPVSLGDVAGDSWSLETCHLTQLTRLRNQLAMARQLVAYAEERLLAEWSETRQPVEFGLDPAHPTRTTNPNPKEPDGP